MTKEAALYKAHPWHGISAGDAIPETVVSFIEIVPTDTVKFEIDKESGYLILDRPQKYSNHSPTLYGFIPQTYSAKHVAQLCADAMGRPDMKGDGDPLDICVISERSILSGNILVRARPVGGLRVIDRDEADDKIIAVVEQDEVYRHVKDVRDLPPHLVDRLRHYFLTYKEIPGSSGPRKIEISETYGRDVAHEVIRRGVKDYEESFRS